MNNNVKDFFNTIEENKNATDFGTIQYNTVAMDGLGMNPNAILNRKTQNGTDGTRVIVSLFGNFNGKLNGTFNGRDFLTVLEDHSFTNTHGTIITKDGQHIAVKFLGETDINGQVCYQIQLRNYSETHNWVNDLILFAKGKTNLSTLQTELTVYAFDENPLTTDFAWEDPDVSTVDYQNFGFTLEDLQNDTSATIIYAGNGHLNGVESFGADINKVFTGQFPIPADGLRMNGYFSGSTAGNVNGVISGTNYLRVMPDGSMRMNSKILANTIEGETLLLEAYGASFMQTGPAWWETSRAVSNLEKFTHLTKLYNLGVGSTNIQTQMIEYNHYGFETVKLKNQK